jgi:hypothetical protein
MRAVVCLAAADGAARWGRPAGLAVVDYAATPVGPYREALVGRLTGPLSGAVPWIVVDSAASAAAGRAHWALPKELGEVRVDADLTEALVVGVGARVLLRVRAAPVAVPVSVPARLRQPGRSPAPVRFRGRGRPALVEVSGQLPLGLGGGARPGVVLDGVLRIGPPRARAAGRSR